MSSLNIGFSNLVGRARVQTDGTLLQAQGIVSASVRNGAGDYTVTLQRAISLIDYDIEPDIMTGARNANANIVLTDSTHVQVLTSVGAGATDEQFTLKIFQRSNAGA